MKSLLAAIVLFSTFSYGQSQNLSQHDQTIIDDNAILYVCLPVMKTGGPRGSQISSNIPAGCVNKIIFSDSVTNTNRSLPFQIIDAQSKLTYDLMQEVQVSNFRSRSGAFKLEAKIEKTIDPVSNKEQEILSVTRISNVVLDPKFVLNQKAFETLSTLIMMGAFPK